MHKLRFSPFLVIPMHTCSCYFFISKFFFNSKIAMLQQLYIFWSKDYHSFNINVMIIFQTLYIKIIYPTRIFIKVTLNISYSESQLFYPMPMSTIKPNYELGQQVYCSCFFLSSTVVFFSRILFICMHKCEFKMSLTLMFPRKMLLNQQFPLA